MGRLERAVDTGGAVADFANGLRELRRGAGSPSYRALARTARFSATTLSAAAAGHRLPSLDVVLAYVRACGGDEPDWRQRWTEAARATGVIDVPSAPDPIETPPARRRPVTWAIGAAAVLLAAVIAVVSTYDGGPSRSAVVDPAGASPGITASGIASPGIADYTDPKASGCAGDGTTLASAAAVGPNHVQYGIVELRYSPSCRFAWTRYTPNTTAAAHSTVVITIDRPVPLGNTSVTFEVLGGAVYSDGLRLTEGCATASAVVTVGHITASAATTCARVPA